MSGPKSPARGQRAIVVSHLRWDRAGELPRAALELHLVRRIDEVLAILRDDPRFPGFVLDGQCALIDDYLAIRPERRADLVEGVRAGRLAIGPWYVLPDELLVSGEALIRNLDLGLRRARELGADGRDAWTPAGRGHVAQLPQLLAGFGLRSFLFVRGVTAELYERAGTEIAWEAPDGTRVLALYLRDGADNGAWLGHPGRSGEIDGRPGETELSAERIAAVIDRLASPSRSGVVLVWNGGERAPAQREAPDLVAAARARRKGTEVVHGTLAAAVDAVLGARQDFTVHRGELLGNAHQPLLAGAWSARIDLKVDNWEAQTWLEKHAEPLAAALGTVAGREHAARLDAAWSELIRAHSHVDIGGTGVDAVHEDGRVHLRSARDAAGAIAADALRALAQRSGILRRAGAEVIAVFNPHLAAHNGAVEAVVHWNGQLADEGLDALALLDPEGKPVRVQVDLLQRETVALLGLEPRRGTELLVTFQARVPGCGLAFYELAQGHAGAQGFPEDVDAATIENEHLRVEARSDGTLSILHKGSGQRFDGALALECRPDRGDLSSFGPDAETAPAFTLGKCSAKTDAWRTMTAAHLRIALDWRIPWIPPRERERLAVRVEFDVRLEDGSARLDVAARVDTQLSDFRLRVLVPLPPGTEELDSDQAFAHVRRRRVPETTPETDPARWQGECGELVPATQYSQSFVLAPAAGVAILVAHRGLHEHQIVDAPSQSGAAGRALALTLWRGVGVVSRAGGRERRVAVGPELRAPGAQHCPPDLPLAFAWQALPGGTAVHDAAPEAQRFAHPPLALQVAFGTSERAVAEPLPRRRSILRCDNANIALSALRVDAGGRVVLRVWNRGARAELATLQLGPDLCGRRTPRSAQRVRLDGAPIGPLALTGTIARVEIGPGAIETLAFEFEERP